MPTAAVPAKLYSTRPVLGSIGIWAVTGLLEAGFPGGPGRYTSPMSQGVETAFHASRKTIVLMIIPSATAVWLGLAALVRRTPQMTAIGVVAVVVGVAGFALAAWWLASLSKINAHRGEV